MGILTAKIPVYDGKGARLLATSTVLKAYNAAHPNQPATSAVGTEVVTWTVIEARTKGWTDAEFLRDQVVLKFVAAPTVESAKEKSVETTALPTARVEKPKSSTRAATGAQGPLFEDRPEARFYRRR